MKNIVKGLLVLVGVAAVATGCAAQTDNATETEGETSSELRTQDYEKIYYSDGTFTHAVGEYYAACGNAPPQHSGNVSTHWYRGTSTPCQGSGAGRTDCYVFTSGDWHVTSCFPFPGQN